MEDNVIDLDEVDYLQARRSRINKISTTDAVFMRGGEEVTMPHNVRVEFDFTGLSTIDFITTGFYLKRDL